MRDTYLRRYTDLPALIYLLSKRKITLLDPTLWDDSNDSHYLSVYKEKKQLQSLLALCFSQTTERYHHWKVFAGNSAGVCIQFKRPQLLEILESRGGIRAEAVEYLQIKDIQENNPEIHQLPFIKRQAFKDEQEFRVIYESETETLNKLDISIPLSCIVKITLSPWSHFSLASTVKRMLKSIEGCNELKIVRSTLVGNREWKSFADSAV